MRKTPFERIRYPFASDVVNVGDVQSMAQDIDMALVQTAGLASNFSRFATATVQRAAAQSITKATLTAITFDTVRVDNGGNSALANGAWYNAAAPTRLTAPVPCVVLASGFGSIQLGSSLGSSGVFEVAISRNGGGTDPQGNKYGPISTDTGFQSVSALSLWKLAAGDYLELKLYWTGSPAGPFSTDTTNLPTLSVMMVALPTVP